MLWSGSAAEVLRAVAVAAVAGETPIDSQTTCRVPQQHCSEIEELLVTVVLWFPGCVNSAYKARQKW